VYVKKFKLYIAYVRYNIYIWLQYIAQKTLRHKGEHFSHPRIRYQVIMILTSQAKYPQWVQGEHREWQATYGSRSQRTMWSASRVHAIIPSRRTVRSRSNQVL